MNKIMLTILLTAAVTALTACGGAKQGSSSVLSPTIPAATPAAGAGAKETDHPDKDPAPTPSATATSQAAPKPSGNSSSNGGKPADTGGKKPSAPEKSPKNIAVTANAEAVTVLVNKRNKLPEDYAPNDLVYPNVRFTFKEKIEKRMMREEAAEALEQLFAAADENGTPLAGVSAYRSHQRQKELFESYVRKDGEEKALTYSAYPGTSEHETGLSIDVAGSDGRCAAEACFGSTKEAKWLAGHAHEYGYIIRYPEGKEAITGYMYEPWHIRYVGKEIAAELNERKITLEEYMDAVEVSGKK